MAEWQLYRALEQARSQEIMTHTFQLEIDLGHRINNINLSSEVSYIIKEVGRLCDDYASDIYYDLKQLFNDLEGEKSVLFDKPEYQWVAGIRDMGVDHDNFIECALRDRGNLEKRYRAIYEISIEPDSKHWYKMTLSKISPFLLRYAYEELTKEGD